MDSLAVPIRVERGGRLARTDRVDAVVEVLATMLITPASQWPDAPWFGLSEVVASLNMQLSEQGHLRDAMNTALEQLGIVWVRVHEVSQERGATGSGQVHFDISLLLVGSDTVVHRPLAV